MRDVKIRKQMFGTMVSLREASRLDLRISMNMTEGFSAFEHHDRRVANLFKDIRVQELKEKGVSDEF